VSESWIRRGCLQRWQTRGAELILSTRSCNFDDFLIRDVAAKIPGGICRQGRLSLNVEKSRAIKSSNLDRSL
jgi:hypothetical protein